MPAHPRLEFAFAQDEVDKAHASSQEFAVRFQAYGRILVFLASRVNPTPQQSTEPIEGEIPEATPYEAALLSTLKTIQTKFKLTLGETIDIVAEQTTRDAGYFLRYERHPKNSDKNAGEA